MEKPVSHDTYSGDIPPDFHLLDDEILIDVKNYTPRKPQQKPSSIQEIYRLTSASKRDEVGNYGPAVAALALESDKPYPEHQGLYSVIFGRDSLRVAIDLVGVYPRLAHATVKKLAEMQGTEYNAGREEEPGRIPHEIRDPSDPIAQQLTSERGWHWPYYGSVDATPEFVRTLSAYCQHNVADGAFLFETYTSKNGEKRHVHQALESAVEWITRRLEENPEGLLEYKSVLPSGIENQVWKDSWDSYHHSDGTIANHDQGIAALEVQAVTHDALIDASHLYETILGNPDKAHELREYAHTLGQNVLSRFWTEEQGGFFVIGLDRDDDGNTRQLKIRTSNMGHLFNSGVLDGDDEERVHKRITTLRQLQSPELLAPAGIRTLASNEIRFREGAYHNGSIWPWDTHHVAKGARRHNHDPEFVAFADELDHRIIHAVQTIGGFPEYLRGGNKIEVTNRVIDVEDTLYHKKHRVEQPPQEVQAWTVAAILATKHRRGHLFL